MFVWKSERFPWDFDGIFKRFCRKLVYNNMREKRKQDGYNKTTTMIYKLIDVGCCVVVRSIRCFHFIAKLLFLDYCRLDQITGKFFGDIGEILVRNTWDFLKGKIFKHFFEGSDHKISHWWGDERTLFLTITFKLIVFLPCSTIFLEWKKDRKNRHLLDIKIKGL